MLMLFESLNFPKNMWFYLEFLKFYSLGSVLPFTSFMDTFNAYCFALKGLFKYDPPFL